MRAFDFFCGVGGLTHGLLDSGIDVIAGVDHDEQCCQAYTKNNPGAKFIHKDVSKIQLGELGLEGPLPKGNNLLFAGCAPCQPFSSHRKWGKQAGPGGNVLGYLGRLVRKAIPDYVLIENVPGIAKVRGFSTVRRFRRMLDDLDYHQVEGILDAKLYGVPQNRRRLVLFATRRGAASLPKPSHGYGVRPIKTVRQAIAHLPPISAGEQHPEVLNHASATVSELNFRRLCATPADGGDRRSWPDALGLSCHKGNYAGHTDVYGRMFWDRPAPALTGRCISISNGRYGHPVQNRAISLREAAALQTFPDGYEFFGTRTNIARQIGNAVPVRLAEKIGKHILHLSKENAFI